MRISSSGPEYIQITKRIQINLVPQFEERATCQLTRQLEYRHPGYPTLGESSGALHSTRSFAASYCFGTGSVPTGSSSVWSPNFSLTSDSNAADIEEHLRRLFCCAPTQHVIMNVAR